MAYRENQGPEEGGAGGLDAEEELRIHMVMGLVVETPRRRSNQWAEVLLLAQDGSLEDVLQQTQMRINQHLQLHPYKPMPRSFAQVRTMCNGRPQLGKGGERHPYQEPRTEQHHAYGEDRVSSRMLPT